MFQHVTSAFKSGELNLVSSYKYRPIDSYLISPECWNQEKEVLLQRAGLQEFADPEPVLDRLNEALLRQYQCTNQNAEANQHLKFRTDGKFYVSTPALEDNETEPFEEWFPQRQDVPFYTFIDERHFLWHSLVISAADRESAYVIDGLMRNDVVKSNIHSTDTHGYTEAVFGLTHLLGFSFAPRIKNLGKQSIYIFKPKNQAHDDWLIQPDRSINDTLIRENWDDLLRLVATIKLKENTASDIFRRLNSYSRQHALYQALKAFGQTIKSLFILRYIDELELRQAIEQQLNKVELANKFTRAVAVGSPREFTQRAFGKYQK